MPLYQYKDKDGNVVERTVPIAERDKQPGLKRLMTFTGPVWAPHTTTGFA